MERTRAIIATVLVLAAMAVPATATSAAEAVPTVTFTLLTPLPTHLAVGEAAVIGVHIESSEPFVMAIALSDAYYPAGASPSTAPRLIRAAPRRTST